MEEGEQIVAFVALAADELLALHVDPTAQGAGLGAAMLAWAEDRLRSNGCERAVLWVFEANGHARGLYERRGWSLAPGAEPDPRLALWAPLVRYAKRLVAP